MTQGFSPHVIQSLVNATNQHQRQIANLDKHVAMLSGIDRVLSSLNVQRSGGMGGLGGPDGVPDRRNGPMVKLDNGSGYVSLDQIPGRALPYDLFVTIPILDGQTSSVSASISVLPAGPFVAVSRMAIFQSTHTVDVTAQDGSKSSYFSRSYGRYRPISSSSDIMDAQRAFEQPNAFQPAYLGAVWNGTDIIPVGNPIGVNPFSDPSSTFRMIPNWPGNGLPIIASALSMSAFRTMSFDGTVELDTRGSQNQRQNIPIPTTFWTKRDGGNVLLPTMDVFEPSEILNFVITPQHPNNPARGNIKDLHFFNTGGGYDTFNATTGQATGNPAPAGQFPSLASQYDGHEGIDASCPPGSSTSTSDPASRNASGLLTIGFSGYYILQAPSVVR